jgi:branched-chain amino acid transport system substrate-binding protein
MRTRPEKRRRRFIAASSVALAAALALSACSSSKSSTGSSPAGSTGGSSTATGTSSGGVIKIGVLRAASGQGSSGYETVETGVKAYLNPINAAGGVNGQKIEYIMADDASTPAGALTAVQKLVQKDKVFAIISESSNYFGASKYALQQGIPVIGLGLDGTEWADKSYTNLFSDQGVNNLDDLYADSGLLMKALGVTTCGAVGYIESPSSVKATEGFRKSCIAAGLKGGYVTNIHFGSTDVGPVALAIKNAKTDGVYLATVPSSGFALAAALKQYGAQMKGVVLATGYGGDLLQSSAAVAAAQGFVFNSNGAPVEANTPATQQFVKNLAAVGYTGTPTFAIQTTYLATAAFVAGLKAAGANPTQQSYSAALRKVTDFDADGLLAPIKVNFSDYSPATQCLWAVSLTGKKFTSVPGSPFCGGQIK